MKNIKKGFTLIELLVCIFFFAFFAVFIINLTSTVFQKREKIAFDFKKISLSETVNSEFPTMVCYFNEKENVGIDNSNTIKYEKFYVRNTTNTDEENGLCELLKTKGQLQKFGADDTQKLTSFILTRTNLNNIVNYKILYVLEDEESGGNIIRVGSGLITGFLTKGINGNFNEMYDELMKNEVTYNLSDGKNVSSNEFGFKVDSIRINMIDSSSVDLNINEGDYSFNYNYFLFQIMLAKGENSSVDYYMFRNG